MPSKRGAPEPSQPDKPPRDQSYKRSVNKGDKRAVFEELKMRNAGKTRGRPLNPKSPSKPAVTIDKKFELHEMFKKLHNNDLGSVWEILALSDPDISCKNEIELDLDKLDGSLVDRLYCYIKEKITSYTLEADTNPNSSLPKNHPGEHTIINTEEFPITENKGSTKDETPLSHADSSGGHNITQPDVDGIDDEFPHEDGGIGVGGGDYGMGIEALKESGDKKGLIEANMGGNPGFGILGKRHPEAEDFGSNVLNNSSGVSAYCNFGQIGRKLLNSEELAGSQCREGNNLEGRTHGVPELDMSDKMSDQTSNSSFVTKSDDGE